MLLADLHKGESCGNVGNIFIRNGLFANPEEADLATPVRFTNAVAYPGFINSHDHLDFNLFPALGNRIYNNYREWGNDIHSNNRSIIDPIMRIPEAVRVRWGMYKNLLSGFTTVVNHGAALSISDPFINVYQDAASMHSPGFEKNWKWKLNLSFKTKAPVAIHVGEGTDALAHNEIDQLIAWNLYAKDLVGIHGVAMDTQQAKKFKALVWCPASNYFLFNKTANIVELKKHTHILFGSDSTLTAPWNIWEHLVPVQGTTALTKTELLQSLTTSPAAVWNMLDRASIVPGRVADLVIVKKQNREDLLINDPEDILLVIQNGQIRLFDETLYEQLTPYINRNRFSMISYTETCNKYVYGNLPRLAGMTRKWCPGIVLPINIDLIRA